MSKMDALRAMREARYERSLTGQTLRGDAPAPKARRATPAAAPAVRAPASPEPAADENGEQLCGHKAISGRTCTRERGHAAKSHRYA
jgi:hypothetical protein